MRNISTALKTWLAGGHLTVAICVLLVRTDGVAFGFTTFDRNLTIGGRAVRGEQRDHGESEQAGSGDKRRQSEYQWHPA